MNANNKAESDAEAFIPMTAAWVTPILGRAGRVMYMGPLLQKLAGSFKDFSVIAAEYGGPTEDLGFKTVITGGVHRLYRPDPNGYAYGFTLIGPSLLAAILRQKPDLLILTEFSLTTVYGLIARRLLRNSRAVLIIETRPWHKPSKLFDAVRKFIRARLAQGADAILTNNSEGRRYVTDELGVPDNRVVTRPYLVSNLPTDNKDRGDSLQRFGDLTPQSAIHFLYVGELIERKGVQHAISAFGKLNAAERNRFVFHVVGDGPFSDHLKAQSQALGISKQIIFHGRQPYEALASLYGIAHVFIFPTHRDYRALAPFEALSMGLPILASTRDGGITETVVENENGYQFDPYDEDELAKLIESIIAHPGRLADFSTKSLKIAKRYTLDNAVDAIRSACRLALRIRN